MPNTNTADLAALRTKLAKARALHVDADNAGRTHEAEAAYLAMQRISKRIKEALAA